MSLLVATGVVCRLGGRTVVDTVDVTVAPGEVFGLLGPNGAGKTTLIRCIAGLERASAGAVQLDGRALDGLSVDARARLGLAYLPQGDSVFGGLSTRANIELVLEISGRLDKTKGSGAKRSGAKRRQRAGELLETFGLGAVAEQRAATLSGGEKRRLELAKVLALEPRVALLDEPLAGLNPIASRELAREISKLRAAGVGVLLSDHDVRQALTICDRACILAAGVVVASGTPAEVARDEQARRVFFGEKVNLEQAWA